MLNDTNFGAKEEILRKGGDVYVIQHVGGANHGEYIEVPPHHGWQIMHRDWLHATWWLTEREAREEIADSVRDLYHVIKITVNTEDISI